MYHHHPIHNQSIHNHQFLNHTRTITRPTLKRSQSPYTPDLSSSSSSNQDYKKRKTSPTSAFAKLSLTTKNEDHQITNSSLNLKPKLLLESNHSDQKMKSIYSAYELEPNRIIINSIGSEPSTPIKEESESSLLLNQFKINYQLPLINNTIDLPLISKEDQQQLVIYKAPIHLTLNHHLHSSSKEEDQSESEIEIISENLINDLEVPMELD